MKVYIAADYARKEEVRSLAFGLEDEGLDVTSTWAMDDSFGTTEAGVGATAADPVLAHLMAAQDLADVGRADALVLLTTGELTRGGRQAEFGMAMALGKRLLVVGPREHVFHWHQRVTVVSDWPAAVSVLRGWDV